MDATQKRLREAAEIRKKLEAEPGRTTMPIGTPVNVLKDSGEIVETVTRSLPYVAPSGTWVVFAEGITGYYALERVTPR